MEKKFFSFLIGFLITLSYAHAQKVLRGVVKIAGNPVPRLTVYAPFATVQTDSLGRYSLPLDGCSYCKPGNQVKIYTHKESIGMSEQTCTIGNDYQYDFSISRNPDKIFLIGVVENQENGSRLPGIFISFIMPENIEVQPVTTNAFGEFKIQLPKSYMEKINAVQLNVSDPLKHYRQISNGQNLYPIGAFIVIKMKSQEGKKLSVSGHTVTTICYAKGDIITIEAAGNIRVGGFVGTSDPDGRPSGVMGMSLEGYNIVANYNHAVLMYRRVGETEWKVAGKYRRFYATGSGGCLEFQVNDINQDDNEGAYDVSISIDKGG